MKRLRARHDRSSSRGILDHISPHKRGTQVPTSRSENTLYPMSRNSVESSSETAFVFPGQGAQFRGMGKALFSRHKQLVERADEVLGYSVEDLCLHDPDKQLNKTQFTQPALYTVNALWYFETISARGEKPHYVAGHSLGEYNALLAAEVFDFATGLELVKKRGELMSQATSGGMAAVLGMRQQAIEEALKEHGLEQVGIANLNTPSQIVISGAKDEVVRARDVLDAGEGVRCIQLNVSGAFHSPLMAPAQSEFRRFLSLFTFSKPKMTVISNVAAAPYPPQQIARLLEEQITSPVRWTDTIRVMMGLGVDDIEEIGPGKTLTKLLSAIRKEAKPLVVSARSAVNGSARNGANGQVRNQPRETSNRPVEIRPESLGSASFKSDYNLRYAYYSGSMYKGIASKELVAKMGKAGLMGFLGTGGMRPEEIEADIRWVQRELSEGQSYGMNLLSNPSAPELEERTVALYLSHGIRNVEASAYITVSSALVHFRLQGLEQASDGSILRKNRIIAKISRPEVASAFLAPAPEPIVQKLLSQRRITAEQARLARQVPMADDLCVEADSGGHTDCGVASALLPSITRLRDEVVRERGYAQPIRVGAAGGIGTPEAALAAFMLGADFIVTGSINQCTVEAGTSDAVKDMLEGMGVQDTEYAPAGDMFELGARVQVLKKGVFFPSRAQKLYDLYRQHGSLDEIAPRTRARIEQKYFKRSFDDVWAETRTYLESRPALLKEAERNPKRKMALVFRWYFAYSSRLALQGETGNRVDFQIHCGPALGSFNEWVKGTDLESWRRRHVDVIARRLLDETATLMTRNLGKYLLPEGALR
jgi:trans-AT polyketide synthase/acyltransferase/oxidoreductase domain-containing protein